MQQYNERTEAMKSAMVKEYVSVNPEANPVANLIMSDETLRGVIRQYTLFPATIVSFLRAAQEGTARAGWGDVASELERNISEELGSESDDKIHYDILRQAMQETLSMDIRGISASPATREFIRGMREAVNDADPAYVLGAVHALEATAVPELQIVRSLVDRAAKACGRELSPTMKYFFDLHINDLEIGHEGRLRDEGSKYLNSAVLFQERLQEALNRYETGFRRTMEVMDRWWKSLAAEAKAHK